MKKSEKIIAIQKLLHKLDAEISFATLREIIAAMTPILKIPSFSHAVYSFRATENSELMDIYARIRQICWQSYGCANKEEKDIDFYDTHKESCYQQILIWDTKKQKMLGGLRYVSMVELRETLGFLPEMPAIRTCEMFDLSHGFTKDYLPHLLEIQRLFVIPEKEYKETDISAQHSSNVVDSLFRGIGTIISREKIRYLTGRILFPPVVTSEAENIMIMDFLNNYFSAYNLMIPKEKFRNGLSSYLSPMYKQRKPRKKRDVSEVPREALHSLPTLLRIYLNLCTQFYFLGAVAEPEMAHALEVAIMMRTQDFQPRFAKRYFLQSPSFFIPEDSS